MTGTVDLLKSVNSRIDALFDQGCKTPVTIIHRFRPGQGMNLHNDEPLSGVSFGVVVYLNDNYLGGELVYPSKEEIKALHNDRFKDERVQFNPDKAIAYKPKAGDLICHASNIYHKVQNVEGELDRYAMSAFVKYCTVENCNAQCWNKPSEAVEYDIYGVKRTRDKAVD
jgi:hypothetical protein